MTCETERYLQAAQGLIATEEVWCQEAPFDTDIVTGTLCRCAAQALAEVTGTSISFVHSTQAYQALEAVAVLAGYDPETAKDDPVEWFNDTHTHAEVMDLFRQAIANTRKTP